MSAFESEPKDTDLGNPLSPSAAEEVPVPVADVEPSLWLVKMGATISTSSVGVGLGVGIGVGLAIANLSFVSPDVTPLRALSQICRAGGDVLIVLPLFSLSRVARERYWAALGAFIAT